MCVPRFSEVVIVLNRPLGLAILCANKEARALLLFYVLETFSLKVHRHH